MVLRHREHGRGHHGCGLVGADERQGVTLTVMVTASECAVRTSLALRIATLAVRYQGDGPAHCTYPRRSLG